MFLYFNATIFNDETVFGAPKNFIDSWAFVNLKICVELELSVK